LREKLPRSREGGRVSQTGGVQDEVKNLKKSKKKERDLLSEKKKKKQ